MRSHRGVGRPRDCEAISYCLSASVRVPSSGHPIAAASHPPLSGPEEEHGRRESAAGAGRSLRTVGGVPKQHRARVVVRDENHDVVQREHLLRSERKVARMHRTPLAGSSSRSRP